MRGDERIRTAVCVATNDCEYDPRPLARALLADPSAPPLCVIAAWKCIYLDQPDDLRDLAFAAVDDTLGRYVA